MNALEPEWRRLAAIDPNATMFQLWPWNAAWLDHLAGRARLRTLVAIDRGEVVGIAPLVVRRAYGTPWRRLQWIGTGVSDYLGPLAAPGRAADMAEALAGYLGSRASRYWDAADLHQLRAGAAEYCSLPGRRVAQAAAPYRPLPETFEAFEASLGKKLRGNVRYTRRRLEREGELEIATAGPDDLDREMDAFFHLHALRWRRRWQPGVLFGHSVQAFHRQAARGLLGDGVLRLHVLRLNGRTAAALYCFAHRDVGYYYLSGFDPELARHGVGTLLTACAIRAAIDEGCREFDFLRGREPYKYRWGCIDRLNYRVLCEGRGTLGASAVRALLWEQAVNDWYESRSHGGPAVGAENEGTAAAAPASLE